MLSSTPLVRHILFRRSISFNVFSRAPFSVLARTMAQEYKLKDLSSLNDIKDGQMKQCEVEGVEGAQIVVACTGGKHHALSGKCTHYGAPLAKGSLSSSTGTIRCPWHGACFNVATGDVEDAPAIDPLAKFELTEKNNAVYVKGEESVLKANRRQNALKCSGTSEGTILVVGGGSGTVGLIHGLREHGSNAPVTVIHKEPNLPIDRPKLSKALITDANQVLLRKQDWYDSASVKFVQDEVKSIDFDKKSVQTASGKSRSYSKLILATGGAPKSLPLPGFKDGLQNIFTVRAIPDTEKIVHAVGESKGKNIVIVGGSFIGLEVAGALAKDNKVTVVDMVDVPMKAVLGDEVGRGIQKIFEGNGVKFHLNAGVEKASPSSSDSSKVGAIHLKDGTTLEADLVIAGVGVGPATEYLKDNSSVKMEKDGSLKVDANFRVAGVSDVYAVGDIANFPYNGPTSDGTHTRIEHWNVAQNQGRSVGMQLADSNAKPKPYIPIFWSALGAQLRYCGNTPNGWDDVVIDGTPADKQFVAYYCKGETVGAVATMGRDPIMAKTVDLMAAGKMPTKQELQKGKDILAL